MGNESTGEEQQVKQLPTRWCPLSQIPGYEQRVNEKGHLETRPIAQQERTPEAAMQFPIDKTDAWEARQDSAKPQPAEPDVVERVAIAALNRFAEVNPYARNLKQDWAHATIAIRNDWKDAAEAALQEAAAHFEAEKQKALAEQEERLLREPTQEELDYADDHTTDYMDMPGVVIASRRTKEKVDPAERVTIKRGLNDEIMIYCDGVHVCDATAEGGDCIVKALVAQMRGKDTQ